MKLINNLRLRLKKKLFFKNLILSAGLVLLSLVLIGFAFSLISYDYVVREQRKTLDSTADVIATTARAVSAEAELSAWELKITITSVSLATGSHISICSLSGSVLATSDLELYSSRLGYTMPEELISALYTDGSWSGLSDLGGYYESKRWVSAVVVKDKYTEEPLGYVFAASQRGDIGEIWRSYALIFLLAALIVIAVVIPVSVLLSRKQSQPLSEMAEAARSFARSDFSVRLREYDRQDEIGELAKAFNQMAESLEKSEQNRREFISNVSHELKTPMTTIGGYAEGMLDGTIPMENAEKYLTVIADETRRLSRLVRKMLDISRMKERPPSDASFDICETLTRTLLSLEAKINDRKLELDLRLPEAEGSVQSLAVKGDMDDVSQVIYNILDNAVKFAAEGTQLRVYVWTQDRKAYVSISDVGENIPEDELPYIFERFHKSDKSRGLDRDGVGLGLYIVKTIIDRMGEDIWVRSRDGVTEFVFSLTLL
jgi:signal transduction histidine kinase